MNFLRWGTIPTYAALLTEYPSLGTALYDLTPGTRVFVKDFNCWMRRSANGTFWETDIGQSGPVTLSPGHLVSPLGPLGCLLTNNASTTRTTVRSAYYRMFGSRARTVNSVSSYLSAQGAYGATDTLIDVRIYEANPDGSPIYKAPLYVFTFADLTINPLAAGGNGPAGVTGAAGSLPMASATTGQWYTAPLPGGAREFPQHWHGVQRHNYTTTPPNISSLAQSSPAADAAPRTFVTGASGVAGALGSAGYTWTEAAFVAGEFKVWGESGGVNTAELTTLGYNTNCMVYNVAN